MDESIALEEPGIEEAEPDTEVNEGETEVEGGAADTGTDEESEEGDELEEEEPEVIELKLGSQVLTVPKDSVDPDVLEKVNEYTSGLEASVTQKQQKLSEGLNAIEQQQETLNKLENLNTELLNDYAVGRALEVRHEELRQIPVDWQKDPDHARQVSDAIRQVESEYSHYESKVAAGRSALDQQKQAALEQQRQAGEKAINEAIPEFSSKHKDAVIAYAIAQGVPEAQAKTEWNVNPFATKMAYKAMKYDQMIAKSKTTTKPGVKPAKVLSKARKGSGGTGGKSPAKMTPEEYRRNWQSKARK